jgi:hypothetical protein
MAKNSVSLRPCTTLLDYIFQRSQVFIEKNRTCPQYYTFHGSYFAVLRDANDLADKLRPAARLLFTFGLDERNRAPLLGELKHLSFKLHKFVLRVAAHRC